MKFCFYNQTFDFNIETPFLQPLGGTESAICYLAIELSRAGHQVTLVSKDSAPGTYRGVECVDLVEATRDFFHTRSFDIVVVSNHAAFSVQLRPLLPPQTRMALWSGHDRDQPAMQPLHQQEIGSTWDLIVLVSEYQRTGFVNRFHIKPERFVILRNAIGPRFENLFSSFAEMSAAKSVPGLAYNSTPFRGLNLLPVIFEEFHKAHPETRLRIYSSMKVYQQADPSQFEELYQQLTRLEGVEYIGSLPQPQLAEALKSAYILAYPNTFAETSCIAVMEAMAAGSFILTSELGALPETTAGFGELIPVAFTPIQKYAEQYYQSLEMVYQAFLTRREEILLHLWNQVLYVNQNNTWRVRARQWEESLVQTLGINTA